MTLLLVITVLVCNRPEREAEFVGLNDKCLWNVMKSDEMIILWINSHDIFVWILFKLVLFKIISVSSFITEKNGLDIR